MFTFYVVFTFYIGFHQKMELDSSFHVTRYIHHFVNKFEEQNKNYSFSSFSSNAADLIRVQDCSSEVMCF